MQNSETDVSVHPQYIDKDKLVELLMIFLRKQKVVICIDLNIVIYSVDVKHAAPLISSALPSDTTSV